MTPDSSIRRIKTDAAQQEKSNGLGNEKEISLQLIHQYFDGAFAGRGYGSLLRRRLRTFANHRRCLCQTADFVDLYIPANPFKYKDIVGVSKDALMAGLTTGNLFIILPVLIQNCKSLFEQYKLDHPDIDSSVDIIVPVSFNFPNLGKLLMLLFILFAGWFYGATVSLLEYPNFIFSGPFSFFGSVDVVVKGKLVEELFDHWILGRGAEEKQPRWSIIRDVMGWVD
ncbi:MAG: hypothetical protein PVH27_16075 [Desulfobacterales bacterium]|jgi:hypothetical protein